MNEEVEIALACEIQRLAVEISHGEIAHVFVDYAGHVDSLNVYARAIGAEYGAPHLLNHYVYLRGADTVPALNQVIIDLKALRDGERNTP